MSQCHPDDMPGGRPYSDEPDETVFVLEAKGWLPVSTVTDEEAQRASFVIQVQTAPDAEWLDWSGFRTIPEVRKQFDSLYGHYRESLKDGIYRSFRVVRR